MHSTNLRNTRSGIVHAALAGYVICQTRTNAGAYTATDEPISCRNCLKQPVTRAGVAQVLAADPLAADDIDVTRLTRAQFDGEACIRCHASEPGMVRVGHGENGPLFQCLTCSLHSITDKEIKIAFLAGNISTITILRDLFDEFGLDPDRRAWSAKELLTAEELDEITHTVKLIVWRRRGVKVPGDPMSLAAMNAGILVGVEAAEKYGVAEAYRRVERGVGVLTPQETERTLRFVRGLAESRYIENPDNAEGPPCGDLRCGLCYVVAAADLTGGEV
ncbi:hypothetical protein [Streptosporangium sp. NPDC004631]